MEEEKKAAEELAKTTEESEKRSAAEKALEDQEAVNKYIIELAAAVAATQSSHCCCYYGKIFKLSLTFISVFYQTEAAADKLEVKRKNYNDYDGNDSSHKDDGKGERKGSQRDDGERTARS